MVCVPGAVHSVLSEPVVSYAADLQDSMPHIMIVQHAC